MTTYLAVMDEARVANRFLCAGFVGSAEAWDAIRRDWHPVLAGPPRLPHLHMTDLRSRAWRKQHKLDRWDAERRIDEATRIMRRPGSMNLISSQVNAAHFSNVLGDKKFIRSGPQPGTFRNEPDYLCFLSFVYVALVRLVEVGATFDRVDFLVENKTGVSKHFQEFFGRTAEHLRKFDAHVVADRVGGLEVGGKDRIELQAADIACWHLQRHFQGGEIDDTDSLRLRRIAQSGEMHQAWSRKQVSDLAATAPRDVPSPFVLKTPKPRTQGPRL